MNVFVTGGTGFIGSHLVAELLRAGHTVTCYARNPQKISGFQGISRLGWLKGNLQDIMTLKHGLNDQDVCIHLALNWDTSAQGMLENDTRPAVILAETAARLGIKRFIYISSTAAIGEYRPNMDEETSCRPLDFYGATKSATEMFLFAISKVYDLPCTIIRPGYVFGEPAVEGAPMEPDDRFRRIVEGLKKGADMEFIRNDGTQFIWVGDLMKLCMQAIKEQSMTKIYIAVGSEYITWEEICLKAREILGSKSIIRTKDIGWSRGGFSYNPSRVTNELGMIFWARKRICDHINYISTQVEISWDKRIELYGSNKR
jgi:UDP-glucose 4-epimerase